MLNKCWQPHDGVIQPNITGSILWSVDVVAAVFDSKFERLWLSFLPCLAVVVFVV